MDSKDLIYKYGHFYDKNTGQRLELSEGANIQIVALANDFIPATEVGKWPDVLLNPAMKEAEVRSEEGFKDLKKLSVQGTFLYFSIPPKEERGDTYEFKVKLLEDLYVYLKNDWKKDKLFDCACTVVAVVSNNIAYFEEIKAKSLNEAYKTTYVHFFGNAGNPACNALDRFYECPGFRGLTIGRNRIVKT